MNTLTTAAFLKTLSDDKIRRDFPPAFDSMALLERELNFALCDGVFLDELPPTAGRYKEEPPMECGVLCE